VKQFTETLLLNSVTDILGTSTTFLHVQASRPPEPRIKNKVFYAERPTFESNHVLCWLLCLPTSILTFDKS